MPFKSVGDEMGKFKQGDLHSGSPTGPVVKNRKQAVAISLSEQRQASGLAGLKAAVGKKGKKKH